MKSANELLFTDGLTTVFFLNSCDLIDGAAGAFFTKDN
jgi:hypothetical protein